MILELYISGKMVAREPITYNSYEVIRAIMDDLIFRYVKKYDDYEFYMVMPSKMSNTYTYEDDLKETGKQN